MKIVFFSLSLENHVCCAYVFVQSNVIARLLQFTKTSVMGLESIILRTNKTYSYGFVFYIFLLSFKTIRFKPLLTIECLSLAKHLSTLESCVCVFQFS